ncbi:threonine/serine ThrE exporter family protein [Nocardioides pantholopis]|uniref:threonine/serine ThrE exporter family protein n=1 Tax=Nocardioides pantholopis TaxID=2483798 RepID=UPI000FDA03F4|nr:threonine/serine exporter family protein [Nocardioides pantholopis]
MLDTREVNLTLDFCLRVGELLLSSGAGAADVAATMQLVSRHLGLRNADIDVTFTSLSMSHQPTPEDPAILATRLVKQRTIDYEHLTRVDHLVRAVVLDEVDLKEARTELARITSSGHIRPRWAVTLGWGAMCAGVALQLGGDLLVVGLAFVAAVLIDRLQQRLSRQRLPVFYQQVAGGGLATLIALLAALTPLDVNVSLVVTANIVMLLAGIGFMGALQDALSGFYITGTARLTEAILATAGIIGGVSGGLAVADVLSVRIPPLDPGRGDLQSFGMLMVGAAVCAAAFAYSSYAPGRIIAPVAVVAAAAIAISQSIALPGIGRTWSVAMAALFVGLVAFSVAGRMRVPPLIVVVSAVVPMLPGLSIYRGLTLLAEGGPGDTSAGLLAMVTAASVAIALAAGVILGEYVAQPLKREARRVESRLAGPRLVGPLRTRTRSRRRRERH